MGTPPASSTGHLQTPARYQRRLPVPWEVWAACQAWDAGFGPSHCFDWGCCLDSGSLSLLSSDSFLVMSNHRSDVTSLCLKLSDIRCGGEARSPFVEGKAEKGADPAVRTHQVTGLMSSCVPWAALSLSLPQGCPAAL